MQTEFELFVKPQSAGEIGTSRASINRTGKTNASKGCHTNYNDYKEFHEREVEAHICAAFMNMSSMSKIDGNYKMFISADNLFLAREGGGGGVSLYTVVEGMTAQYF